MKNSNKNEAHVFVNAEDFIAMETNGDEIIFFYKNETDRKELFDRMKAAGNNDADLIMASTDPCARYSKRECDQAGGCCTWVTSGSFNFCKCI